MSFIDDFNRNMANTKAPTVIPSPLDVVKTTCSLVASYKNALSAHIKHVRREQEEFQGRLETLGIERVMRMRHKDVIELCGGPVR